MKNTIFKNKLILILLICVLAFSMTGFKKNSPATQEEQQTEQQEETASTKEIKNPDTFITASDDVETLDLHFMSSASTTCVSYNVYDSLLYRTPAGEIKPCLATSIPSLDNDLIKIQDNGNTTIEFPIRENVKFHNGEILTPEDIKYTFTRGIIVGALSDLTQALTGEGSFNSVVEKVGLDEAYDVLDNAIIIEGNSIIFHLAQPFAPFIDIVSDNGAAYGILNKKWAVEEGAWPGTKETVKDFISITDEDNTLHNKMMGTGPFKLESWEQGERIVIERFDDYWQGPAKLKRVIRQVTADNNTAIQQLQKGDIDFITLGLSEVPQVEGYEGIKVIKDIPASQLIKINFNFDIKGDKYLGNKEFGPDGAPSNLFSDLDVRKAFSYTFDYQTFIDEVLLGSGIKPYGPVLVGYPTANPDNPQYDLDLEKAEEHFKKAFDGELWEKGFKLTVPYSAGSTARQRALEILKANLQQINPKFDLEITSLPWAAYVGGINDSEIPMSIFGILPDYEHPYCSLAYHMYSEDYYAQVNGYADLAKEKYDPLIKELASSFDDERVEELSHTLQKYSYGDALSIFLHQVIAQVGMRDWVQGYEITPIPFIVDYYNISKEYK